MTLTQGGLCEGYGGLSMAVAGVLGAELAWYSEIDPAACALLAHHHPDLPNVGDLTVADWDQVQPVDVLTGGWPCQPWSLAGQRKGAADERAIWPHVARAVRALRPRLVVLENVASIAPAGELARAAGDLAALGYVGSWRRVRASDVGAPHHRARIFICARPAVADPTHVGHERGGAARRRGTGPAYGGHADPHAARIGRGAEGRNDGLWSEGLESGPVADAERVGRAGRDPGSPAGSQRPQEPWAATEGRGAAAAYSEGEGWEGPGPEPAWGGPERGSTPDVDWAGYAPAIQRWEHVTGRRAPSPTVLGARGGRQLSARFAEWLMGLPDGHVTDVPGISRNAQLKLCGNGVVPQQAAHALRLMLAADTAGVAA